jgi:hypothetical protein
MAKKKRRKMHGLGDLVWDIADDVKDLVKDEFQSQTRGRDSGKRRFLQVIRRRGRSSLARALRADGRPADGHPGPDREGGRPLPGEVRSEGG